MFKKKIELFEFSFDLLCGFSDTAESISRKQVAGLQILKINSLGSCLKVCSIEEWTPQCCQHKGVRPPQFCIHWRILFWSKNPRNFKIIWNWSIGNLHRVQEKLFHPKNRGLKILQHCLLKGTVWWDFLVWVFFMNQ